ncbi:MAG TPA: ComEC/Rec2 family competence protein [Oscillospiraceae bacterium]|nr:MBL fold metallo-hydrolase [Oscillospiraceae bacterium]HNW04629.1 ComEC/Rec2 family competence protein [Oscillospiraceae bacterium]HPW00414.1 ComEC/Rec2 family competence protein [Oscillospiraceae bacterium]
MKKRTLRTVVVILFILASLIFAALDGRLPGIRLFGPAQQTAGPAGEGNAEVHFLDTGQSDCTLILTGEKAVLIDAGTSDRGDSIVEYLKERGVHTIDLIIATHPHADHIGGMADVFRNFEVKEFLMPDIPDEYQPTTRGWEKLLIAADEEGCAVTLADPGQEYPLGAGCVLTVLGPAGDYGDDYNNWSVVTRLVCGGVSFLFTGDAEKKAEDDMLSTGAELDSDVLKVGHHGSSTSSGEDFMEVVSPEYAAILCGAGNDYGHPHQETTDLLERMGVEVYRTDLDGAIVMRTDGKTITVSTEN